MDLYTLLLFIPACLALNLAPGPNNLLSISNATRFGFRAACVAGFGRLLAFAGMIALAASGLAVVLHASETLFYAIKVAGAVYLFWLAWQLWHAAPGTDSTAAGGVAIGLARLARQEFLVAAGNPKAILIFTAFLPQFVEPGRPMAPQFALLGSLFLVLELAAIAVYAAIGSRLRHWFARPRGRELFNRGCAGLLSGAAVGLLLARRGSAS
ncbi:LysE family translocator [Pseudoduganella umbonata]|uniref:LysE family translocator n=1 Tax=Pseudoduganella umbonata TaxID=864828 RepID=A0A4P8HYT9_9BURK|nr:LysE family translocator [Pseudoduganella umbonata]MBB3223370.1 threonine/homoserine/homoserine lactone efflux protein [Pseudoduganella umbonata]QCP13724.1 LysE family translocator [Pseudoduganella umbonata]